MYEKLNQFQRNNAWTLVSKPIDQTIIRIHWAFKNKLDENGVIVRKKVCLVVVG